jgi:DnaJ like chaperone protein
MIYGKLVAGVIGFLVAGPLGLLVGILIGHSFDKGLGHTFSHGSTEHLSLVRETFFETSFLLMGLVAKADGRVSEHEVSEAEQTMAQLGVGADQRQAAIRLFQRGSASDFRPEPVLSRFNEVCGSHRKVAYTLLVFMISMALADGQLHAAERKILEDVARQLGYPAARFAHLLEMVQAQGRFHGAGASANPGARLDDAYVALGVVQSCNDKDLKRAYRRLMSEHHPDKLIAQGVPEEMIKIATAKSQEIQSAYETVKKARSA